MRAKFPAREGPADRKLFTRFQPGWLLLIGVGLVVAYLALSPLAYLLWGTFGEGGRLTLAPFRRAYEAFGVGTLIGNSFQFAVGATFISVTLGACFAYLTERTDIRFRRALFATSLVPLVIPGILYTVAWVFMASPRTGLINVILEPVLGPETFDIFSMAGMIVVEGLDNVPLAFLLMVAAFRSMDPGLEEAALVSGARLSTVIRRVTLPMAAPGILAATLVLMVRNLESFQTPAVLGIPAGEWVLTTRIWRVLNEFPADFGQAGAYSLSLLVFTTAGIVLYNRMVGTSSRYETISGRGYTPRRMRLGGWSWPWLAFIATYFTVAIVLPSLMLVHMSTQPFNRPPSLEAFSAASLDNYRWVLGESQTRTAFRNSIVLGVAAASVTMLLAGVSAWIVVKSKITGRWLLDNLTFMPLVFPGLVLGVAFLFIYLRSPIVIYGTLWILLLVYITKFIPYGMRYASTSMYQVSKELEESAAVSGATWWRVFSRVVVPLILPGLIAGWLYVFMNAVRELSSSLLLYSPGSEVLAVTIWLLWDNGKLNELAALGVLMIGLLVLTVVIGQQIAAMLRRRALQSDGNDIPTATGV